MTSTVVQKYGGSSVGTPEKIKKVAAKIAAAKRAGKELVVIVSAMGDFTDDLLELAAKVTPNRHERELDMLLTSGERISMALLSMALKDLQIDAISFTGSQAGIITDENHTQARVIEIKPIRVREELAKGKVVIVAGFQGVSRTKEITTLGRGGSDTTAAEMAAALGAACEIYTDVEGVYSADPRKVDGAQKYEKLPHSIVLEMANTGAQVMHSRSIEAAMRAGIPLFVGSTETGKGTWLLPEKFELKPVVAVCALNNQVSLVGPSIGDNKEIQTAAQSAMQRCGILAEGLTSHGDSIRFSIKDAQVIDAVRALHQKFFNT